MKAIVVSQYTDWKWDGNHQTDLILDVPFDDRGLVKGRAVWVDGVIGTTAGLEPRYPTMN